MKQTNSLQKSYDPFANGRWYRVFLESDGTNIKITESDLPLTVGGSDSLFINSNIFNLYQYIFGKVELVTTETNIQSPQYYIKFVTTSTSKRIFIGTPNAKEFTSCELFIFGEKNND